MCSDKILWQLYATRLFAGLLIQINDKDEYQRSASLILFEWTPTVTVKYPSQRANNAGNVTVSWCYTFAL